jgi:hypothetical protein
MNDPLYMDPGNDLCCRHLHGVDMGRSDIRVMELVQIGLWILLGLGIALASRGPDPLPGMVS